MHIVICNVANLLSKSDFFGVKSMIFYCETMKKDAFHVTADKQKSSDVKPPDRFHKRNNSQICLYLRSS